MTFNDFNLHAQLSDALHYMGFKAPTPIQEQSIPEILKGRDIIACAQTGTGKTAAYLLPIISNILNNPGPQTKAMIIVPTRELAIQIDQQVEGLCYDTGITSLAIYGGGSGDDWSQQKHALTEGVNIVIATPGKLISHLNMGYVNFDDIKFVVLDEADRMLDIGFHDDVLKIFSFIKNGRQTLMFSATMPHKIREFAKKILTNPFEVSLAVSKPAEGVIQQVYMVHDSSKIKLIEHLLSDAKDWKSIIVFSSTKSNVFEIVNALRRKGLEAEGISSDLEQQEREDVLLRFRSKKIRILVATDVISRGIDIKDINLVLNYNVPKDAEDYIHRIGRTARAETTGVAITFVNDKDIHAFQKVEKMIGRELEKLQPPAEIGKGPEWTSEQRPFRSGGGGKPKFFRRKPQARS